MLLLRLDVTNSEQILQAVQKALDLKTWMWFLTMPVMVIEMNCRTLTVNPSHHKTEKFENF